MWGIVNVHRENSSHWLRNTLHTARIRTWLIKTDSINYVPRCVTKKCLWSNSTFDHQFGWAMWTFLRKGSKKKKTEQIGSYRTRLIKMDSINYIPSRVTQKIPTSALRKQEINTRTHTHTRGRADRVLPSTRTERRSGILSIPNFGQSANQVLQNKPTQNTCG